MMRLRSSMPPSRAGLNSLRRAASREITSSRSGAILSRSEPASSKSDSRRMKEPAVAGCFPSDIHRPHVIVAGAGGKAFGRDFLDSSQVAVRKLDGRRGDVFFQIFAPLGAGYRYHVVALREHPRE